MKPREFWIYKETALLLENRNINIHDQHLFVHAIDYDSYKELQRKLEIAKSALIEAQKTFHYVYCSNEQSHSHFCNQTSKALEEINK